MHGRSLLPKSRVPRPRCAQRSEASAEPYATLRTSKSNCEDMSFAASLQQDTDEYKEWQCHVGQRVCINGVKHGILRYFGRTGFSHGYWCGVELDEPVGRHNGTVDGVVYYSCRTNHGIFAPVGKVSKVTDNNGWLKNQRWSGGNPMSNADFNNGWSSASQMVDNGWSVQEEYRQKRASWGYDATEPSEFQANRFSVRNSPSDPSFVRVDASRRQQTVMSRPSDTFSCDKRAVTEQRDRGRHYNISSREISRQRAQSEVSASTVKSSTSSRCLSKYEHGPNNQYSRLSHEDFSAQKARLSMSNIEDKIYASQNTMFSYESKRSSDISSNCMKEPDSYLDSFQPHEFSDFEDDEYTSADCEESIGILTPSQMRELGRDLPMSLSDHRNLEFPSSESFDEINELPEDEQVHDLSVFQIPESSTKKKDIIAQPNVCGYAAKNCDKKSNTFHELETEDSAPQTYKECLQSYKIHNLATNSITSFNKLEKSFESSKTVSSVVKINENGNRDQNLTSKIHSLPDSSFLKTISKASVEKESNSNSLCSISKDSTSHASDDNCVKASFSKSSKNYDLQVEVENNCIVKEKLTVSWEDCLSRNKDSSSFHEERPESVYTVDSCDTGFNEDGELEADTGMATSIDSADSSKRFSTVSRDSCLVSEEIDVYKIAESNSTSGYSTGLSDSCCNDRDDPSSKRLTDEEIPDSVGPCDSEDGFSFQDNSLSKDLEMPTAEATDVTPENATVLFNDSASDALCETMVEDATLTEINELLLSPEDNNQETTSDGKSSLSMESDIITGEVNGNSNNNSKQHSPQGSTTHSSPENKSNSSRAKSDTSKSTNSLNRPAKTSKLIKSSSEEVKPIVPKSPKKNVMSKIKAMLDSSSSKIDNTTTEPVTKRPPAPPKKSRWDAVTSKIAQSLAEEKTKPKARKEIRSRVDTNLTLAKNQSAACKSPLMDSNRASICDGSMSPLSVSSRDRRVSTEKTRVTGSAFGRTRASKESSQRPKSPRPGSSRCVSPSESSTASISLNSKSKIAPWKASSSTIASSIPPALPKRASVPPALKPSITPHPTTRAAASKAINKKTIAPAPKIRITRAPSPTRLVKNERKTTKANTKEHHGSVRTSKSAAPSPIRPTAWLSKAELGQEIQRLSTLCEARTKELQRLKMETKHVTVGFDAFAAMFKYMVEDINGLSAPVLSADLQKTLKQLELTKQDLAYYEREVEELKAHHCQELNDLSNKLFEVFQGEVSELTTKHQEEVNRLQLEHQKQIEELSTSFSSESTENSAKQAAVLEELKQELGKQREELQLFHERELRDQEEKQEASIQTLRDHIEQLQKKCAELKHHSQGMEDAMRQDTNTKLQWVASAKGDLEKEVESLKTVLELKNKELHTLRIQTLEQEKELEDLPLAREKIKMLQARAEDLEALMAEKTNLERRLQSENEEIRDTYEKESKVNRRLSMENEELQWRLKQSEQTFISASFSEIPEDHPESPEVPQSPIKSPRNHPAESRSKFFTFVDANDLSSTPRTPYRKVTSHFSADYKTSPAKVSPARGKSQSEPPQPDFGQPRPNNTPKRMSRQLINRQQKRVQRSGSDCSRQNKGHNDEGRMTSSVIEFSTAQSTDQTSIFYTSVTEDTLCMLDAPDNRSLPVGALREMGSGDAPDCKGVPEGAHCKMHSGSGDATTTKALEDQRVKEGNSTLPEILDPQTATAIVSPDMARSTEFSDPKSYYQMTFSEEKENNSAHSEAKIREESVGSKDVSQEAKKQVVPMETSDT